MQKCVWILKSFFKRNKNILLFYFIEFKEDDIILFKEYLKNCVVGSLNQ